MSSNPAFSPKILHHIKIFLIVTADVKGGRYNGTIGSKDQEKGGSTMLEIIFSKEVLTVLSVALAVIAAISGSAVLMERKGRKKYRRPSEARQK